VKCNTTLHKNLSMKVGLVANESYELQLQLRCKDADF
jgi:hypothetical protein